VNVEALEALQESVVVWQDIVDGKRASEGMDSCPLCAMFVSNNCSGCPVREHTSTCGCHGTPYANFADKCHNKLLAPDDVEGKRLAQAELDFLKSLIPRT
jgi:hypothetical protein